MNDMIPGIGHNGSPDPIDLVTTEYSDLIEEAQNWTDGEKVQNEAQMKAVDDLIKGFKTYRAALAKAGKERTDPLHKAWKAEVAAVKVYTDDADRIQAALVETVAPFKAKLAAKKEADRKAAWEAAREAEREAEAKARAADAANLDDQREADAAKAKALEAKKAASAAQKDTVKGLRTIWKHEVTSTSDMLRWINANDRAALDAFCEAYAGKVYRDNPQIPGLRVWSEKEAF